MIDLKVGRDHTDDVRYEQIHYMESLPFLVNPRGVLAHRVKSLFSLQWKKTGQLWYIVEYWCYSYANIDATVIDEALVDDPRPRLVCARCETAAIDSHMPLSSELVGEHVCVGGVRAINLCDQHGVENQ